MKKLWEPIKVTELVNGRARLQTQVVWFQGLWFTLVQCWLWLEFYKESKSLQVTLTLQHSFGMPADHVLPACSYDCLPPGPLAFSVPLWLCTSAPNVLLPSRDQWTDLDSFFCLWSWPQHPFQDVCPWCLDFDHKEKVLSWPWIWPWERENGKSYATAEHSSEELLTSAVSLRTAVREIG